MSILGLSWLRNKHISKNLVSREADCYVKISF
jgi:hypothetical protein